MKLSKKQLKRRYKMMCEDLEACVKVLEQRSAELGSNVEETATGGETCQLACDQLAVSAVVKELACATGE